MEKVVKVKGIRIGDGIPKICVPIVGDFDKHIIRRAKETAEIKPDIVEWRADWFQDIEDLERVKGMLEQLKLILGNIPLLFTFRTYAEGGQRKISAEKYMEICKYVITTKKVDMIDVELMIGDEVVQEIISYAHKYGVKVIASNHDFHKTPEKEEIIARLCKMQELDADVLKIAVMPENNKDVLRLLEATDEMNEKYANRPIATISMSGTGLISRISGEMFGSAITFGSVGKASAPGQMNAENLKKVLSMIHQSV